MTIRKVSEQSGASRMALYRHVRDKQELCELVADEISWQAVPRELDETSTGRPSCVPLPTAFGKGFRPIRPFSTS